MSPMEDPNTIIFDWQGQRYMVDRQGFHDDSYIELPQQDAQRSTDNTADDPLKQVLLRAVANPHTGELYLQPVLPERHHRSTRYVAVLIEAEADVSGSFPQQFIDLAKEYFPHWPALHEALDTHNRQKVMALLSQLRLQTPAFQEQLSTLQRQNDHEGIARLREAQLAATSLLPWLAITSLDSPPDS